MMSNTSKPVTIALLGYKSVPWIDFAVAGIAKAKNRTKYKLMVVGNDPTDEVANSGRLTHIFRNPDPAEYYINRVYRAWNYAVKEAQTDLVVLLNSDMRVSDGWLDALVEAYGKDEDYVLPCSLLVESGRIESAMPEHVKNFGTTPDNFQYANWESHATYMRHRSDTLKNISLTKQGNSEPGRLFMPVLLNRDAFLAVNGYPEGNVNGVSGDRVLFNRLWEIGYNHVTALGSVVYHVQEGEMRDN
jgi:GT2 family glycosyltransferase